MRAQIIRGGTPQAVLHELKAIHTDLVQAIWVVSTRQDLANQLLEEIRDALNEAHEDEEVTAEALMESRDRLDKLTPKPLKKGTPDDLEELYRRWIV